MISTVLAGVPWLPFIVLIATLALAPAVGAWLATMPRLTRALAAAALVAVALLTLTPDGEPRTSISCEVALPYLAPTAAESTANVLLFVPVAFLVGVALRRPLAAMLASVCVSGAIEATQALLPAIGRACDTGDLVTNAIGAVLGALCAAGALALRRQLDARAGRESAVRR